MDAYKEQFFSDVEGAPRAAVKRLTRAIETELLEATINAPDWLVRQSKFDPSHTEPLGTRYTPRA